VHDARARVRGVRPRLPFADSMAEDARTSDVLRTDHHVKSVFQARIDGDRVARGRAAHAPAEDYNKHNKKKDPRDALV
jgi:glycyl-tRNA synthetase